MPGSKCWGVIMWSLTQMEWNPRASVRCAVIRRPSMGMVFP